MSEALTTPTGEPDTAPDQKTQPANDPATVFERTVIRAERDSQANPGRYRMRLLAFALLGYVVIFALLAILVSLVAGVVAAAIFSTAAFLLLLKKKLIFILLPTIWLIGKALWVKFDAPDGYRLDRKQFPALWEEVDQLRRALKTPPVHDVILTPELNAAVAQTPRLGIFGWQRNTVILGLELLLTLSPAQARAVLAHEFGHLSGNHSRFSGWIYRVRESWNRLMSAFEEQASFGGRALSRFFHWYAPRFAAYSFVLARSNEFDADATSGELTTTSDAAAALVNTHVTGAHLDENYWREYFRSADDCAAPAHMPWAGLKQFLSDDNRPVQALEERLARALLAETDHADTHPALKDRLAALGVEPSLPMASEQTAAESWLGGSYPDVIADFDRDWFACNESRWKERFEYVQSSRSRLAELNTASGERKLADEELWEQAHMTEEFDSQDAAYPLFLAFQARHPTDPAAAFVLGRILYDRGEPGVVEHMKIAMASEDLAFDACQYAYHHLINSNLAGDAEYFRNEAQRLQQQHWESQAERSQLDPKDNLQVASISAELREQVIAALEASPLVAKAWLAEKPMNHHPEVPALAIAVKPKGWQLSEEKLASQLAEAFELTGCTHFVVPITGDYRALARQITKVGERIV